MRINNQWLMDASLFKSVRLAEQAVIAAAELAGDALIFFAALGLLLGSQVLEKEVREPSSAVEWKQLGLDLASRQKLDAASSAFEKACALDTREEDACYYYARTLHALGRWEEARDPFEKALRTAPKSKLARTHRAVALNFVALSRAAEAERHFQEAVRRNPGAEQLPEDPRVDYGAFLFRQGQTDEALPLLHQAVQAAPRSARAHAELGRVLLHLGKSGDAVSSLEKAVELDPRAAAVRLLLGRAYLQVGRVEEGERELERARQDLTVR